MQKLPRVQAEVLTSLIEETSQYAPPTPGRMSKLLGKNTRPILVALMAKGYVTQHYLHGPWIPLRDVDGSALRLVLVKDEEGCAA